MCLRMIQCQKDQVSIHYKSNLQDMCVYICVLFMYLLCCIFLPETDEVIHVARGRYCSLPYIYIYII